MKYFIALLILTVSFNTVSAQNKKNNKPDKSHAALVKASAKNGTALLSRDSLYCSGELRALNIIKETSGNKKVVIQEFNAPKTGDRLLEIKLITVNDSQSYYNFHFIPLGIHCDVINKTGQLENLPDVICKYRLFKHNGIDTVNAETFVVLKGSYKAKLEQQKSKAENFFVVSRNKKADIILMGNDVYQDSKIIGSIQESTVPTPSGNVKQIQFYNTNKTLVCIATCTASTGRNWRVFTHADNKYRIIDCTSPNDDIYDILNLIISNGQL